MPTNDQIRSWWTEACRSGSCSVCDRSGDTGEVLQFDFGGLLVRFCNDCCGQLMRELQNRGIKPFARYRRRR